MITNQPPVAVDDTATTDQDQPVQIAVLANDTDADNDPLVISALVQPLNGSVVAAANGVVSYTPVAGFTGTDTFSYDATDPDGAASTATVTVTVNAVITNVLPVALDDSATTLEGTPVSITVLANDTDADNDPLTVSAVTAPADGTASINADGTVEYVPAVAFSGVDTFDYTIDDGVSGTASGRVTVTVTAAPVAPPVAAVNTPPVAVDDVAVATVGGTTRIRVLDNDSDPDGDTLELTLDATLPPSSGTVTVHNNGRWLNYTAGALAGTDSVGYIIDDGNGGTDSATVTIAIADI